MEPITIKLASGEEQFRINTEPSNFTVRDFWAWAYSDFLTNTSRGILAEFIVALALGIDIRHPRKAWDKFDLTYQGKGIEVKSASHHQAWFQKKISNVSFSIPATRSWDDKTNTLSSTPSRDANYYILTLLAEKTRDQVDPLNIDQWLFWVIPTTFFEQRTRSQQSITYKSLLREVGEPILFGKVKTEIDKMINSEDSLH